MKLRYLLPALLFVACHGKDSSQLSRHLQHLADEKEYFRLDKALQAETDLPDVQISYFNAILDNAFNHNEACISTVDSLLGINALPFPDSIKVNLLQLQADSYFKLGQYAKAALNDSLVIARYPKSLTKDALDDIRNDSLIRNALKNTPPQQTTIADNTTIHWTRDSIGLIEIPVNTGGQAVNAIFDTRANISSITRTYADKLHLHLINVSYQESSGITGARFQVSLGIADSVHIGNILVRNAVFQVMPDSILYLAPIKFQLNLILGMPVIEQLGEIQWYANGDMTFPRTPGTSNLHNLALDGLDPVMALATGNDTLVFDFDTGATTSVLYYAYFKEQKATILKTAVKKTQMFGGAGGVTKKDSYILPSLLLALDHKTVSVDSVSILTEKIFPGEKLYGNIGQDFMKQFTEMTINFHDMYITGK
jgi:predicted aspartyl protease